MGRPASGFPGLIFGSPALSPGVSTPSAMQQVYLVWTNYQTSARVPLPKLIVPDLFFGHTKSKLAQNGTAGYIAIHAGAPTQIGCQRITARQQTGSRSNT